MKIKIFTTGGTIDKVYFDKLSEYAVGPPYIDKCLKGLTLGFDYEVKSLFKRDSLDITDQERNKIFSAIKSSPDSHIVVTHGTDTMVKTARSLSMIKNKVIVLTGAMEPGKFSDSDAVFNIGIAIGAVQSVKEGIYIAMNGRIFNPHKVKKNRTTGCFEELI